MRISVLTILSIIFCSSLVLSRKATCNKHTDKYAPDHTFYTGQLDPGFDNDKIGIGFVFYSRKMAFTPEQIASYPTLIYISGGPGTSSMINAYQENGPYQVLFKDGAQIIQQNPDAWTNKYNVLYIDQPIGVGFSPFTQRSDIPSTQIKVNEQFYKALTSFYTGSGCYSNPIFHESKVFLTGFSYAGKYIPNFATEIIKQNKLISSTGMPFIPLVGITIGNPLIDPENQLHQIADFAFSNQLIIDQTRIEVEGFLTQMKGDIAEKKYSDAFDVYDKAYKHIIKNSITQFKNVYNFKKEYPPKEIIEDFCNDYIQKFGFDEDYKFVGFGVFSFLALKDEVFSPNGVPALQSILANNLPTLIYNGDNDIMVTSIGIKYSMDRLEWAGQKVFQNLPMINVMSNPVNGSPQIIGTQKSYMNLSLATISDAGHMSSFDQPVSVNIILDKFIEQTLKKEPEPPKPSAGSYLNPSSQFSYICIITFLIMDFKRVQTVFHMFL